MRSARTVAAKVLPVLRRLEQGLGQGLGQGPLGQGQGQGQGQAARPASFRV